MIRFLSVMFRWTALAVIVLVIAAVISARALLHASLPREAGAARVAGLAAAVEVSRDDRGVPRIRATGTDLADALAALGYLHAQERFFQMDVMRRRASGELAELFGPVGLPSDREMRKFRFRSVAERLLPGLPAHHRRWIESYTRGVNAGLDDLAVRPPEYLALFQRPEPWLEADCLLAAFAMHHGLSMGARFELQNDVLTALAPAGVAEFLMPETARTDSPLMGPAGDPLSPAPIPGPEALKPWSAELPAAPAASAIDGGDEPMPLGSNNFAIAAVKSRDGRAILANDMHLALSTPPTWYHAQIEWGGRRLVGVTLPGVPGIAAGSNGRIAWGHTNVTGDFEDFVKVEQHPTDPGRYRFGPGESDFEPYEEVVEILEVRGGSSERLVLRGTRWGVVTNRGARGEPLVLKWPALDPGTVNLGILDLMTAESIESGVEFAGRWWGPPQNVLIASHDGRIAWVVSGWIPRREGIDGRTPSSWVAPKDGLVGWSGPIEESDRPRLFDPPEGLLFSANARTLPVERARVLGWCWASGERAGRISARLREMDSITEEDLLSLQLDTRATNFDGLRDLILEFIEPDDADASIASARSAVERWNGRADAESVGFRVLVRFHAILEERLVRPLWVQRRAWDPGFNYWCMQDEEPLRRILEERPAHFLPAEQPSWSGFFRDTLKRSLRKPGSNREYEPSAAWVDVNRVRVVHPFSIAVPMLGRFLNMPEEGLPGHMSTVRVQGRAFGASERLVVSPGHEEDGILHMPAGQSGHPLSRHYSDGHGAWSRGERRPLLSGPFVTTFRLEPAR